MSAPRARSSKVEPLFEDVSGILNYTNYENVSNDFEVQAAAAESYEPLGPGVSWFDIDGMAGRFDHRRSRRWLDGNFQKPGPRVAWFANEENKHNHCVAYVERRRTTRRASSDRESARAEARIC